VEAEGEADEEDEELEELAPEGQLVSLVPVRISSPSQVEQYQAGEIVLDKGDLVVVETERGQVVGHVVAPSVRQVVLDGTARKVIRRMDRNDLRQQIRNQRKAREAYAFGRERASTRSLKMKLVRVDYLHGGNKAVFYFTADGRIDFRELIKDLARRFRIRVEMRQIGVRDEAGLTGGVGTCGLQLCCNTFLRRFEQISIRMAKDQALVLNPQKISGQCGRLKCCLVYEHELYQAMRRGLPKVGKRIETPKGHGKVIDLDILKRRIKVGLDEGPVESFTASELGLEGPSKPEGTSKPDDPKEQG
jgi:cell fate regulator YaaT (PSP1 superfamily)